MSEDIRIFESHLERYRYDFCKLVYLIFPFGDPDSDMVDMEPYDWQMEEWDKMSKHLSNPATRYEPYRLAVSSGNGAAKTAFGAMTMIMLLYTQKLRGRVTANTKPQVQQIVWPEYDVWFRRAKYNDVFFEKLGESIKSKDAKYSEQWRFDMFAWNDAAPQRISGLHNKGHAILYIFEEAAGIPSIIWDYASGAYTDVDTIKIWLAFANSDDPNSAFEQRVEGFPGWRGRRIDTRTQSHVDREQIAQWLKEAGGDEDDDNFRVRVRGMPRKAASDAIIKLINVENAVARGSKLDLSLYKTFPSVLTLDPAWTGNDSNALWHHQGACSTLLEIFKLDKDKGDDHRVAYNKMSAYERELEVDSVLLDQAEGTGIKTLANMYNKWYYELIHFNNKPTDVFPHTDSKYYNVRAQMYDLANLALVEGHSIRFGPKITSEQKELAVKHLTCAKSTRSKVNDKLLVEKKQDIKDRAGWSPDIADAFALRWARTHIERLPGHNGSGDTYEDNEMEEVDYESLYGN